MAVVVMVAVVMAVGEATVAAVFTVAAASMVEVRRFTAADFAPLMFSTAAASATVGSGFGTIAFTGTSTRPITITRIIIRTIAAG